MRWIVVCAALATLAACSTYEVEGASALSAKELDAALSLYGPWNERLTINGRPVYLWRRHLQQDGQDYYCELRVEMGFRRTIRRSYMQGYPTACELFKVHYETKLK